MEPRAGFGPATTALPIFKGWSGFKQYLENNVQRRTGLDYLNGAKQYGQLLLTRDLSQLQSLSPAKKQHAIRALTALSKYLGIHKQ
jgi:hypothetical protein